jgi:hypothetical protein
MKKILFLSLIIVISSCSSDNSDSLMSSSNLINPPSWIHGDWGQVITEDPYLTTNDYRFTNDDICVFAGNISLNCVKAGLAPGVAAGVATKEETITSSLYVFSYTVSGVTQRFEFVRITESEIEQVIGSPLPNIRLVKL